MSNNELNVQIKLGFDEAKAELKAFGKTVMNVLELDLGQALKHGAGTAGIRALQGAGNFVSGAAGQVKSEAELAKSLTLENIQKELTSFATIPLRGVHKQMGALSSAKERTLDQIGILGNTISEKSATDLFDLNFKLDSQMASARTRGEKLLSGRVGPISKALGTAAQEAVTGTGGEKESAGFKFSVEKFEKSVDKFSKILGTKVLD